VASVSNHLYARILSILSIVFLVSSTFIAVEPAVVKADPLTHTLYVDRVDDYSFGPNGAAACADDSEPALDCSLRGAIARANYQLVDGNPANDTDLFVIDMDTQLPDGGVFYLNIDNNTASAFGEDGNMKGDLDILGNVKIMGKTNPADIVIDARDGSSGPSLDRIFDVHLGASAQIQGVTIQYGFPRGIIAGDPEPGGGIRNLGTLVLTNVVVINNATNDGTNSPGGYGGGIYKKGALTASNPRGENKQTGAGKGTGNKQRGGGGGILNDAGGTLYLLSSILKSNHTGAGGPAYDGGSGGGLYNSHIAILNSVDFDANTTGDGAAGSPGGGTGGYGGAIFNNNQGDIKIQGGNYTQNRTGKGGLGQNDALSGGTGGDGGTGGAIANLGTISILQNASFSQNETGAGGDCSYYGSGTGVAGNGGAGGAISNSSQYGLIGDGTATPITFTLDTNRTGAGGRCDGSGVGGHGGGLYNFGNIRSPLQDITIQNNITGAGGAALADYYIDGGDGGNGGGIYNEGIICYHVGGCLQPGALELGIAIDHATITGNRTGAGGAGGYGPSAGASYGGDGGDGGGIFNSITGRIAGIRFSTLEANHTGSGFGLFRTNDSDTGGNGGNGGAIYNAGHITEISYSLLLGNYTGGGGDSTNFGTGGIGGYGGNGGAIALYSVGRISKLFNSTVTQNYTGMGGRGADKHSHRAGGNGGGIYSQETGWIDVRMSTLVDNKTKTRIYSVSDPDDISEAGHGAGFYVLSADLFSVVGSIVSDNYREIPGGTTVGSDCSKMPGEHLQSLGFNVIRNPVTDFTVADIEYQCDVFTNTPANLASKFGPDELGQDPLLQASDPIQYYTPAFIEENPAGDSPAIDLVPMKMKIGEVETPLCGVLDTQLSAYIDQLGHYRPIGMKCDAGSVEIGGRGGGYGIFLPVVRR
jgi:hypothetical protein